MPVCFVSLCLNLHCLQMWYTCCLFDWLIDWLIDLLFVCFVLLPVSFHFHECVNIILISLLWCDKRCFSVTLRQQINTQVKIPFFWGGPPILCCTCSSHSYRLIDESVSVFITCQSFHIICYKNNSTQLISSKPNIGYC